MVVRSWECGENWSEKLKVTIFDVSEADSTPENIMPIFCLHAVATELSENHLRENDEVDTTDVHYERN